MYLCICKAVREQCARQAIGAGACSLRDLHRQLGVGSGCGRCIPDAMKLLRDAEPVSAPSYSCSSRGELAAPPQIAHLPFLTALALLVFQASCLCGDISA